MLQNAKHLSYLKHLSKYSSSHTADTVSYAGPWDKHIRQKHQVTKVSFNYPYARNTLSFQMNNVPYSNWGILP